MPSVTQLIAKGTRITAREHVSDAQMLLYSVTMSGLHGSSLCVEHDEASAMYANIKLVVFVFCFCAAASTL